jgi:hypothetical protein
LGTEKPPSPGRKRMTQPRRDPAKRRGESGTMQGRRSPRSAPPSPTSVADLHQTPSPRTPKSCSSPRKKKLRLRSPTKKSPKGSTSPRDPVVLLSRGDASRFAASLNLLCESPTPETTKPAGLRKRTMTGRPHFPFHLHRPTTATGSPLSDKARHLLHQRVLEHRGRDDLATDLEGAIRRRRQMHIVRLDTAARPMQSLVRGWLVRSQMQRRDISMLLERVSLALPAPTRVSKQKYHLKISPTQRRKKTRSGTERKSKAEGGKNGTHASLSSLPTISHGKRVQFAGLGPT